MCGCPDLVLESDCELVQSTILQRPEATADRGCGSISLELLRAEAGHLPNSRALIGVYLQHFTSDYASICSSGHGLGLLSMPTINRVRTAI
jgi:hypothetical protein